MDLYKQILAALLEKEEAQILFSTLNIDITKVLELECYKTLQKIKAILQDDSLNDKECFMKIEEIICVFEGLGASGGNRHDFG